MVVNDLKLVQRVKKQTKLSFQEWLLNAYCRSGSLECYCIYHNQKAVGLRKKKSQENFQIQEDTVSASVHSQCMPLLLPLPSFDSFKSRTQRGNMIGRISNSPGHSTFKRVLEIEVLACQSLCPRSHHTVCWMSRFVVSAKLPLETPDGPDFTE